MEDLSPLILVESSEPRLDQTESPIISHFLNPIYSDVQLSVFGTTLSLHKVILTQSAKLSSLWDTGRYLLLDTSDWAILTQRGLEVALRDMYILDHSQRPPCSLDRVFEVLVAACYLELSDLCEYCVKIISSELTELNSIVAFAKELDKLVPHLKQSRMLLRYHDRLFKCCLGVIFYCISLCSLDISDSELDPEKYVVPTQGNVVSTAVFIAQLPLSWIEKVLISDCLPAQDEYERYCLTKRIFGLRQNRSERFFSYFSSNITEPTDNNTVEDVEEEAVVAAAAEPNNEENEAFEEILVAAKPMSTMVSAIYNIFDGMLIKTRKRKHIEELSFDVPAEVLSEVLSESKENEPIPEEPPLQLVVQREIKPKRKKNVIPSLPKALANIYQKGIIYTYMTFLQLGIVKKDQIVPFHLALESHWIQSELGTENPTNPLPVFRFSSKLVNLAKHFETNTVMNGQNVTCGGVQYRILLTKEGDKLKVLLQKSRGRGPPLTYDIYLFDHRYSLGQGLIPVTRCGSNGEGFAKEIDVNVKEEGGKDCIWVVIAIQFTTAAD